MAGLKARTTKRPAITEYNVPSPTTTDSPPTRTLEITPRVDPNCDVNIARPSHLDALHDEHSASSLGRHDVVVQKITTQRPAGAAGGGILQDAGAGREHAAVHGAVIGA